MASHCSPETASTVSVECPEQDLGVMVAHMDDESVVDSSKKFLCVKQKTCWIGAVVIFVLAGIAVISVVALGGTGIGETSSDSEAGVQRQSEAFYMDRFAAFRPIVGQFSEASTLIQSGTPQAQALDWLVYEDTTIAHEPPFLDETALKERYAMMVLWYATGGESWQGFDDILSKQGGTVSSRTCCCSYTAK